LEQPSPASTHAGSADADPLEGQVREAYGRVVYTHKTHEKCADILLERLALIKLSQIILSAITTASFVTVVVGSNLAAAVLGTTASTLLLALNTYTKDYDLGELAQKHRHTAGEVWNIREQYLSLLADIRTADIDRQEIRRRRESLREELHATYSGAPSTTFKAYRRAQMSLQQAEEMTFSDAELDTLLPPDLRRC